MISKKDILKMIKHVSKRSRSIPDRRLMHPKREWTITLVMLAVVLVAGSVHSFYKFNKLSNLDKQLVAGESKVVEYKTSLLSDVLDFYEDRTSRFQQIKDGIVPAAVVPDPVVEEISTSTEAVDTSTEASLIEDLDVSTSTEEIVELDS